MSNKKSAFKAPILVPPEDPPKEALVSQEVPDHLKNLTEQQARDAIFARREIRSKRAAERIALVCKEEGVQLVAVVHLMGNNLPTSEIKIIPAD